MAAQFSIVATSQKGGQRALLAGLPFLLHFTKPYLCNLLDRGTTYNVWR